jgi:hypothetical protein
MELAQGMEEDMEEERGLDEQKRAFISERAAPIPFTFKVHATNSCICMQSSVRRIGQSFAA